MAPPGGRDLLFSLFPKEGMGREVNADLFATKLRALVRGLSKIDASLNGSRRFEYVISDLKFSSAVVQLREKETTAKGYRKRPSFELIEVGSRVTTGRATADDATSLAADLYQSLCKGVEAKFSHGEIAGAEPSNVIRIDRYLARTLEKLETAAAEQPGPPPKFFVGTAWGSYEGRLDEIDFRGAVPAGHLTLAAGQTDIECLFYLDEPEIREVLRQQALVEGEAIYDGQTGFPTRILVRCGSACKRDPVSGVIGVQ